VPEFLVHMPAALRHVLESGVATGGICAVLMNWFLPGAPLPVPLSEDATKLEEPY
jgi:xanthine permease XanP